MSYSMLSPILYLTGTDCNSLFVLYVLSERYMLALPGSILTIVGIYLFVSFGPNSHEELNAENIVKHIVAWPILLYLVRNFHLRPQR